MTESKKALVERLFAMHGAALRAFFHRRLREGTDPADLAQEVFARMLRVRDTGTIRNAEAYLFTVAGNLAREHAVREGRRGVSVDIDDPAALNELAEPPEYESQIDTARQVMRLREVLRHLPPRWHAVVVLQYVNGLTHEEIAARLGMSVRMVKRTLAQALGRCRRRRVRQE